MMIGACLIFSACSDFLDVSDELASNLTIEQTFNNVPDVGTPTFLIVFLNIPVYSTLLQVFQTHGILYAEKGVLIITLQKPR